MQSWLVGLVFVLTVYGFGGCTELADPPGSPSSTGGSSTGSSAGGTTAEPPGDGSTGTDLVTSGTGEAGGDSATGSTAASSSGASMGNPTAGTSGIVTMTTMGGGSGTGTGTATGDGGAATDGSSVMESDAMVPVGDIPDPVAEPIVWGVGLGVSDVPAAVEFYTDVMKVTVEKENFERSDRTETVLYASGAQLGARLVLMSYDDGRETRKIAAKLVWQAADRRAVNSAASSYPDYESRLGTLVNQFDGPDTYIQEVGGFFADGGDPPYLVAMGFAVGDLTAARAFYRSLGMDEEYTGAFTVTDAAGRAGITEYTVKYAGGSGLVLQQWDSGRETKDRPVKIILMVPDAQAVADKVVAGGGSIVEEVHRTPLYDNRLLIVTKDPDGYLLELVQ